MKPAERALLARVAAASDVAAVRQAARCGCYKQNLYYLQKWAARGWYEYGVCLDLGWLTAAGRAASAAVQPYPPQG